jgi:N-hydroxyarylamine O-acetyltransferase
MTPNFDSAAYLKRLGFHRHDGPTLESLAALQRAHLEHIPFENLDIHLGNPVILDEELLYEKIVNRHRGGFCYELNGLFAALLEALGYGVTRLSARVFDDGEPGPEFDHLLLLVDLKAEAGWCYLVDVGFGEAFRVPLRLEADRQQPQP